MDGSERMTRRTKNASCRGPLSLLLLLSFTIFTTEALIMLLLGHVEIGASVATFYGFEGTGKVTGTIEGLTDAFLLTVVIFPVLYLLVVRKLDRQNQRLADSEARLEERVVQRTQEIQQLNKDLQSQNERFGAVLENMSQGLCMFDGDQRLLVCNRRYETLYDLPSDLAVPGTELCKILEHRVVNGIFGEEGPDEYLRERFEWAARRERSIRVQHLNDGRTIQITHQPLPDGGWLDTHEDVTELAGVQTTVQRQKEELHQILRSVPRAVITADKNGVIRTFNPAAEQTFGYSADEAIGRNVSLLMPEKDRSRHDGHLRSYLDTGLSRFIDIGPRRLVGCRKDGSEFPMELALGVAGEGDGIMFLAVAKDIAEELEAENKLKEHRDELQAEVDQATAMLKSKARELERSLAKEKAVNEQQRQFITTASHEFRTPLAIIDSSVQRLLRQKDKISPEILEGRTRKIRAAVKTMTNLMESTLAAAQMEGGKVELKIAQCNLRAILLEVCMHQLELNENHKIVCDLKDLPDNIRGDSAALERVFVNLLSNAVKYSPDGPDITVRGWSDGNDALVSVQDQGLGIDEDELPQMFSRFFRATTSSGIPGTGIGLNLVKALVELHDGSIDLESRKGKGSTFTVRLPIDGPSAGQQETKQIVMDAA